MTDVAQIVAGLTKAQRAHLCGEHTGFARGYKPGEKLVALGLLSRRDGSFGDIIGITPLGLAVRTALLSKEGDSADA